MMGTLEASMAPTIWRVESSRPPGVPSSMSRGAAGSRLAWVMARSSRPALMGWMVSRTSILSTSGLLDCALEATAKKVDAQARQREIKPRWCMKTEGEEFRIGYSSSDFAYTPTSTGRVVLIISLFLRYYPCTKVLGAFGFGQKH